MDFFCKYHKNHKLEPSKFDPKNTLVCWVCKSEKIQGRDGIYAIEECHLETHEDVFNKMNFFGSKENNIPVINTDADDYDDDEYDYHIDDYDQYDSNY